MENKEQDQHIELESKYPPCSFYISLDAKGETLEECHNNIEQQLRFISASITNQLESIRNRNNEQ